jgi:hypothetical protein
MTTLRDAPTIRVFVINEENGPPIRPVDLGDRVISFTYEDTEHGCDKVNIELDNYDLDLFERGEDVLGGRMLEVSWGYPGAMSPPRRVVIKNIKGSTQLTVEGNGLGILHHRIEKIRSWDGMVRSEVVREIARELGYQGIAVDVEDTTEIIETINQMGETDARFLKRLASREGFLFWMDDLGLHWRSENFDARPTHIFHWQTAPDIGTAQILTWNIESDLLRRIGRVKVKGRDPIKKKDFECQVAGTDGNASGADRLMQAFIGQQEAGSEVQPLLDAAEADFRTVTKDASGRDRVTLGFIKEVVSPETGKTKDEITNATEAVRHTAAKSAADGNREAAARYRLAERATVKLTATTVGAPTLRAKGTVEMRGISTMFSGLYFVESVIHRIDGNGYTCDLKMCSDAKGARAKAAARPQTGKKNQKKCPEPAGRAAEPTLIELVGRESGRTRLKMVPAGTRITNDIEENQF